MKQPLLALLIIVFLGQTSCTEQQSANTVSLEEQIAQMMLVGFRGLSIKESEHIKRDLEEHGIGGVILYEYDVPSKSRPRNIASKEQVKKLVQELKSASKRPLFVAIDEEGGRITRLKESYGYAASKSAQYLGALNLEDSTRYWTGTIADRLEEHGINLNFAPVVDLNTNPASPAIGKLERSYSADPKVVAMHAGWAIQEYRKKGVLSCIKHFPGHGSALADSHKGFTDVSTTWIESELEPYQSLINSKTCDMIMTAHVFNEKLDAKYPATLSSKVMGDLLRKKFGWKGVIISDDMQMGAIAKHYGLETALELAINAGVDILIFSNNIPGEYDGEIVPKSIQLIKDMVYDGKISNDRIREAYDRIMKLKGTL